MSVLRTENLAKRFDRRLVVKGVNIEIHSAEIIGLLGRNGAGKTTSFQMMAGLLKPDSGNIYIDDKNISRYPSYLRAEAGITYLPQEHSVFLKASVMDNLKLILELQPLRKKEREKIARQLLQELGLLDLAKQAAHSLSGGERKKLEICRSLVIKPKFLLLDEPFTGIDPLTIIELQKILLNLKAKDIGIIISDQNVRDTFKIADRAYIIDDGEILIEGAPRMISSDERAREKFLGKNFEFGGEIRAYSSLEKMRSPSVSPSSSLKKEK
jgi:lipopolysaccharide export system ATP-binding protein